MNETFHMFSAVFYRMLFMSLTALAIGVVILLFRKLTKKRITPSLHCLIWVSLILALLIPYRLESRVSMSAPLESVQNISSHREVTHAQNHYRELFGTRYDVFQGTQAYASFNALYQRYILTDIIIPSIWLAGMVVFLVFLLTSRKRLDKKLARHQTPGDTERIIKLLNSCKEQLDVSASIRLVVQDYIESPAIVGLIKPQIIMPSYVYDMDDQRIKHIILHELGHYKRFDLHINALLLGLQVLYWFNPFVWILFSYIRQDIEHANDAYVLKAIGEEESTIYSYTLVEALGRTNEIPYLPKLYSMANSKNNMMQRIKTIKLAHSFKVNRAFAFTASAVMFFALIILFMTSPLAASGSDPADRQFIGNWAMGDHTDYNEMFAFFPDGTFTYAMRHQFITWYGPVAGHYSVNHEDSSIWLSFDRMVLDANFFAPFFETHSFSFADNGDTLFLSQDYYTRRFTQTANASILQITDMVYPEGPLTIDDVGLWHGIRADGATVSVQFRPTSQITIRIERDDVLVDYYGGWWWLFPDGWMELFLLGIEHRDIWERYMRYSDNLTELPPRDEYWMNVSLSSDGSRLLLLDFLGNEGEVLELTRR